MFSIENICEAVQGYFNNNPATKAEVYIEDALILKDRSYRFFKFYDIKDIDPIIDIAIVNNDRRRKINRLKEKI
jgi:hypothetical protein